MLNDFCYFNIYNSQNECSLFAKKVDTMLRINKAPKAEIIII